MLRVGGLQEARQPLLRRSITCDTGGASTGSPKLLPPQAAQQQSGQNQSSSSAGACCSGPRHSRWYVAGHRSQHSKSPCGGQHLSALCIKDLLLCKLTVTNTLKAHHVGLVKLSFD